MNSMKLIDRMCGKAWRPAESSADSSPRCIISRILVTLATVAYLICLAVLISINADGWGWFAFIGLIVLFALIDDDGSDD